MMWQALRMLCQALQIYVEGTPDDVAGTALHKISGKIPEIPRTL
jgi:hypothetical protein